ncbi:unnamed protein product, partial [Protopolystoma xenopodis]
MKDSCLASVRPSLRPIITGSVEACVQNRKDESQKALHVRLAFDAGICESRPKWRECRGGSLRPETANEVSSYRQIKTFIAHILRCANRSHTLSSFSQLRNLHFRPSIFIHLNGAQGCHKTYEAATSEADLNLYGPLDDDPIQDFQPPYFPPPPPPYHPHLHSHPHSHPHPQPHTHPHPQPHLHAHLHAQSHHMHQMPHLHQAPPPPHLQPNLPVHHSSAPLVHAVGPFAAGLFAHPSTLSTSSDAVGNAASLMANSMATGVIGLNRHDQMQTHLTGLSLHTDIVSSGRRTERIGVSLSGQPVSYSGHFFTGPSTSVGYPQSLGLEYETASNAYRLRQAPRPLEGQTSPSSDPGAPALETRSAYANSNSNSNTNSNSNSNQSSTLKSNANSNSDWLASHLMAAGQVSGQFFTDSTVTCNSSINIINNSSSSSSAGGMRTASPITSFASNASGRDQQLHDIPSLQKTTTTTTTSSVSSASSSQQTSPPPPSSPAPTCVIATAEATVSTVGRLEAGAGRQTFFCPASETTRDARHTLHGQSHA